MSGLELNHNSKGVPTRKYSNSAAEPTWKYVICEGACTRKSLTSFRACVSSVKRFMLSLWVSFTVLTNISWYRPVHKYPDSEVHGANMGPTWVLSAPDGPHVGPMYLAIKVVSVYLVCFKVTPAAPFSQKCRQDPLLCIPVRWWGHSNRNWSVDFWRIIIYPA